MLVTVEELRDAGDGWWRSFPANSASVYSLDVESAALVSWNFQTMTKELTHWSADSGLTRRSGNYP